MGPGRLVLSLSRHRIAHDRGRFASVATVERRGSDPARALMTQEVISREDVVDAQALGARKALADVALEQRLVVDLGAALAVDEPRFRDRLAAGLATDRRFHGSLDASDGPLRRPLR